MTIPSTPLFAMLGLPEIFIVLVGLGCGLALAGALLYLVLRSNASSVETRKRLDQLEREIREGPLPPRIDG